MNVDKEHIGIKKTRGPSELERMTPDYNLLEQFNQIPAGITVAQLLKNPMYKKQMLEMLKTQQHQELKFDNQS